MKLRFVSGHDFTGCGKTRFFEGYGLQPVRICLKTGPALAAEGRFLLATVTFSANCLVVPSLPKILKPLRSYFLLGRKGRPEICTIFHSANKSRGSFPRARRQDNEPPEVDVDAKRLGNFPWDPEFFPGMKLHYLYFSGPGESLCIARFVTKPSGMTNFCASGSSLFRSVTSTLSRPISSLVTTRRR
jgi:hypothetical protein